MIRKGGKGERGKEEKSQRGKGEKRKRGKEEKRTVGKKDRPGVDLECGPAQPSLCFVFIIMAFILF